MARKGCDDDDARVGFLTPVISCLSIAFGFVRMVIEEGLNMGAPILSFIKLWASYLDPIMATWIAVVMLAGYWLKRARLPKWLPPLPVMLLIMYLVIGLVFGYLQYEVTSWKGVERVLLYGIGNGIVYTGFSFVIYDIAHGAVKRVSARKAGKEKKEESA